MGQEILYCFKCQTRIVGTDFGKGAAYEVGNNVCCSKCATELLTTLPPKDRESLIAQMFKATQERKSGSTNSALPAMAAPLTSSSTRMRTAASNPPSERRRSGDTARRLWSQQSKNSMTFAVVGVALLVVLAIVMLNSGGKAAPTGVSTRVIATPTDARPSSAEHDEIRKARDFARAHPQDIDGQIGAWRGALLAADRTPGAELAQKELDRLLVVQKDAVKTALLVLDAQAKPYLANEEFVSAADILRAARSKFAAPEWTMVVDRKIDDARSAAVSLLPDLKQKALAAQRRGAADEVKAIQTRVRKWGHPDLTRDLEAALSEATTPEDRKPPPTPTPVPAGSKELEAYRPRWEAAFRRAAAGDATGAAQELGAAVQALTEAPLKTEGNEDLEALRRAGAALQEIRESVARTPKGQKTSLERWNEAGAAERIDGSVANTEPGRLVLRTESGIVPVDIGELTLVGIADLFAARPSKKPGDERTAALLALLGGDLDRAAKWKVELPERWKTFAPKAAAALTAGREGEARRLFAEAEDAAADPTRIGVALANYKTLLAEYSTTAFVARNRASLNGRPNLGKEYLFVPDTLRGAGTFSLTKAGKMESAWLSERDADAATAAKNFVEFSFTALPDLDYKLWVYAAGCCLETFSFGVQGTEMVLPSARSTAAEPGAAAFIPIRPPLLLKKTHDMHTGAKSPTRWEWIPVPLPKYAAPGIKVVRLLTDQKGFAVAYASVSALTSSTPRESELKEIEKVRTKRALPSEKDIAGLVAHYRLDEGNGTSAQDETGKIEACKISGATWAGGRLGSGLRFDGGNSWAELPNPPALDKLAENSYTIMAWFKPEDLPPGSDDQNNAFYGLILRPGRHIGLAYRGNGCFSLMQWFIDDASNAYVHGAHSRTCPAGVFYHVAGVLDRGSNALLIYINGRLDASEKVDPSLRLLSFSGVPWRLGIGAPGADRWRWCAKGVLDEVRLYNRALTAPEIEALYRSAAPSSGAKPAPDARPWKPVFDGKSIGGINSLCHNAWQLKDGLLTNVTGVDNAAQTSDDFGDGDLRFRLESRGNSVLWFIVRQAGLNGARLDFKQLGDEMNRGEHEVIFTCRGSAVSATIDGKPARLDPIGTMPARGVVQFNCSVDGSLRIRSIDFRDAK